MYYVPYLKSGPFQKFQFLPIQVPPRYIIVHVGGRYFVFFQVLSFPFLSLSSPSIRYTYSLPTLGTYIGIYSSVLASCSLSLSS